MILGRAGLEVSRPGFGTASIGGLYAGVSDRVTGVRSIRHLEAYPSAMARPIPAELWAELRDEGLIRADAPVPGGLP